MPVHPAVPADVPTLIEAYRQTVSSFADVGEGLRPQEWELPTTCPGWSTRDHLAHVVHIESYLAGMEHPGGDASVPSPAPAAPAVTVGDPPHVRNDFGVWNEEGVLARRDRDPAGLLAELRTLMEVRSAAMYTPELTLETPVRSVMGLDGPFGPVTQHRLIDIWAHEQDLRDAVGRPGSLDSPGASTYVQAILDALPRLVVRRVRPEPGTVVILESTGPVNGRGGVRVGLDAEGALVGHELFTGHTGADDVRPSVDDDSHDRTTTIALSTSALARRAAGRVSTAETAYNVTGDEDLARQVLEALVLTP
ncbi:MULTISPECIES: maleylpyruvate isomerase family mycothiol-dependent enzyme [unclassified Ornithinimicrobium]|uniref:maleylpyruvate isomerase family mycothiol-dependent enzyme n=1 Tax=unclassified Ornithinimicrobium TaxID=2615080 RepID=UPI003852FF39